LSKKSSSFRFSGEREMLRGLSPSRRDSYNPAARDESKHESDEGDHEQYVDRSTQRIT
jgi:hypothetical protein